MLKKRLFTLIMCICTICNFTYAKKLELFISNGALYSIQKFVSQTSNENEVEFCGWVPNNTYPLVTSQDTTNLFNTARQYSRSMSGTINIPASITETVTYHGHVQGNATYHVVAIAASLFEDSHSITRVNIPKSVRLIESRVFQNCTALTDIVFEEGSVLEEIDSHAFYMCHSLMNINLPNTVKKMGETGPTTIDGGVFEECTSLESITIPSNSWFDNEVPNYTFKNCTNLKTINWNNTKPKTLGVQAFLGCVNLKWEQIPTSVTELRSECFRYANFQDGVNLSNITKMGNWVFANTQLQTVDWNCNINYIPTGTFESCNKINNISGTNWDNVITINDYAFKNCDNLTDITLPSALTTILTEGFADCDNLTHVNYGTNLYEIGNSAFLNTPKISKFFFKGNVKKLGDHAFKNSGLTCVHLKGDMIIGNWAFEGCNKLRYVEFPETSNPTEPLSRVSEGMFYNCQNLPFITLPKTVTNIGNYAFEKCVKLQYINILGDVHVTLGIRAFSGTIGDVYVKASKLQVYRSDPNWSVYNIKDTYTRRMDNKYATLTHDFPVSFVGNKPMEAYVGTSTYEVTQPTKVQKILHMTKVSEIASCEGVILKGNIGETYTYRIAENEPNKIVGNKIMPVKEDSVYSQVESDGLTNWVVAKLHSDYKINKLKDNSTLVSGKAYVHELDDLSTGFGAKSFTLLFNNDEINSDSNNVTNGIDTINKNSEQYNNYYTLSGIKVADTNNKGIYIKNSKKIIR